MDSLDKNIFAQKVAHLCYEKFEVLPKSGKPLTGREWIPIAAVIKHQSGVGTHILSLATGTKCIGQSKLNARGDIIHDSHAEVLARRGFMRYLYEQIGLIKTYESEIFTLCSSKNILLRPGITFHFFTSETPCGDASIVPRVHEYQLDNYSCEDLKSSSLMYSGDTRKQFLPCNLFEAPKDENTRIREFLIQDSDAFSCQRLADENSKVKTDFIDCATDDIHRTGAKCLPGDRLQDPKLPGEQYHTVGLVRTKPGRGDRTQSVSCSDKILRWNNVGIQGALLTTLIKPIYFSSIIVGCNKTFYSPHSMYRAIVNRNPSLDRIRPLNESPLLIHVPYEFRYSKLRIKTNTKLVRPAACSILWCDLKKSKNHEVYVEGRQLGSTNKRPGCKPSLVSKKQFLICFKDVTESEFDNLTYADCKMLSTDYQQKCIQFKIAVGQWPEKDRNLFLFK